MKSKICFKIICFQDIYNFESEYQFKKLHKEEYLIFALTVISAIRFCYSFLCDAFDEVVCIHDHGHLQRTLNVQGTLKSVAID